MKTIQKQHIMKRFKSILSLLLLSFFLMTFQNCVHDDDYSVPSVECSEDIVASLSIADLKALYQGNEFQITDELVLEGYIVSSDESGNIYKSLYIQDDPANPTHGLTISIDQGDLYTRFPVGYKVFISLKDLWLGEYGGVIQLGDITLDPDSGEYEFGRIPALKLDANFRLGCELYDIVPKVVSMNALNSNLVGALVQFDAVELTSNYICEPYSLPEQTLNRIIKDCDNNEILLRNSGYATFTNETMPGGNGNMVAILGKYNDDYQLLIRSSEDMSMMTNARCDGQIVDCATPENAIATIADVKASYSGGLTQISSDLIFDGIVTANDATGNLYKYFYMEDETGGIRVNLDKTNLNFDPKYQVGKRIVVKAKDLYIDSVNGELQLGGLYNNTVGRILEEEIYIHIFGTEDSETVSPTAMTIDGIGAGDVGTFISLEGVEFIDGDVGLPFAAGGNTNRTIQDCNGNTILIRTSSYASFAGESTPGGNGMVYGILSVYEGTYQIWLRNSTEVMMDATRCDGSTPASTVFTATFDDGGSDWFTQSILGAQVWDFPNFGNPAPCARMSGYSGGAVENEDWLVSPAIDLMGYSTASVSFDNVKRYDGADMEAYYSVDFAGDATTATWVALSPILDTDTTSWSSWTNSGALDISAATGGTVHVAIKYISDASTAATWEIDNVKVVAGE